MTNSARRTVSTMTTARIMLTFCIQYKSSKPPTTYTWVYDFGPHMDLIFRGGATYTRSDLYASIYGTWYTASCDCLASTPPLYRADIGLSRVSSSGSVSSLADDAVAQSMALGLNMEVMADLVQEKMCDLTDKKHGSYLSLTTSSVYCPLAFLADLLKLKKTRQYDTINLMLVGYFQAIFS